MMSETSVQSLNEAVSKLINKTSKDEDGGSVLLRFENWSALRLMVHDLIEAPRFGNSILAVIVINTILVGLQTDSSIMLKQGEGAVVVADGGR